MNPPLTSERLRRKAIVYVRQSSMLQVTHNLESQRRQYGLATRAQELGFHDIEVIDEDLGRSGSGCVERPGFERLVAQVCSGEVGGVICVEASRLARNGRDWHHLIELCGLVDTVIIDPEGIYDPNVTNDRLLLGLKGTMSEFELNLIRQRSREAIQQKASRGELQFRLPAGLCWNVDHIELEPDQRIQQALRLVFQKMEELGSARQVFLWFRQQQLSVPVRAPDGKLIWKPPRYSTVMYILSNPFYAGAYSFGRTQIRTRVVDGRARKTRGYRRRDQQQWRVLIRDHHPSYITWERYEQNQRMIEANAHMKSRTQPKAGRGGRALLAGLLRCRRCGRMLKVNYTGAGGTVLRYSCSGEPLDNPGCQCISFGGLKADELVVQQILAAVSGNAIEAALQAAEQERMRQREHRRSLELGIEQARYQARLAERRYEAVDPEQRLVAGELEARWNLALERAREAEAKCADFDQQLETAAIPSQDLLVSLAHDLPAAWSAAADMRLKQRIVHLVLREIIADVHQPSREVTLILHWAGGRHSEVRWTKNKVGLHGRSNLTAVEVIGKMAGKFPDDEIAKTLNRQRQRTGSEHSWTAQRVAYTRTNHNLPVFQENDREEPTMTLQRAAKRLQVSAPAVRRLIARGALPARQIVNCAPWQIPEEALDSEAVKQALERIGQRQGVRTLKDNRQQQIFSDT
jgi:DNA invertase Pin-like site-specific DNA recombinase